MRRKIKRKHTLAPDPVYTSEKVSKFINCIMEQGKKNAARKLVYGAFEVIKEKAKVEDPLFVFDEALRNVGPAMEVRSRRVGGANYQVPREVRPERRERTSTSGPAFLIAVSNISRGFGLPVFSLITSKDL
jgi:small subunit ribosomal protein S7